MLVTTRTATLSDVPALNQLIEQAVRQLSTGYYSSRQIESSLKYVFGIDTQLIEDGTYYVAEADGQLAGCGGWSQRNTLYGGDQSKSVADPRLDPRHEPGRIRAFFVHPQWTRRGIGRAILEVCEAAAHRAGFRRLELAATLPGEPLYRALGYEASTHFTHTFPDGEQLPLIRMHKALDTTPNYLPS
ncbi:GNAT family N-acetyltransferase [Hymenobacter sp. BT664]|uniref:GNAT family N-acetyltransferase n=1 Tax=Hymenobacter montanus TaxID=2771359 RepID=A0A927GIE2_9BACT|nr:GNAT family N-acetyltransferase [Hymenobacter montanus]MBD2767307.1 GNAT family N-acetyltransferase [Hymenobacter montanus]